MFVIAHWSFDPIKRPTIHIVKTWVTVPPTGHVM